MGQGFDEGGVDRQQGVEEVSEADPVGLGNEAEEGAVGVEGPGNGLGDGFEAVLVAPVQNLGGHLPRIGSAGDLDCP